MQPPPEIPKNDVEEVSLEEFDLLLDDLADSDVKTARRRRFSNTLIAAIAISILGIWQTFHTFSGGEPLFQLAAKSQAGQLESQVNQRMHSRRFIAPVDPTATYIARAKRGMTDQEIRWTLEDFQQVENRPLSGVIEQSRAFREKQNQWYLTALSEALSLTLEQKRITSKSLTKLLDQAEEQFKRQVNEASVSGERPSGLVIEPYEQASFWLGGPEFAPWNLCRLTEEQSALTMQKPWQEQKKAAMELVSPSNQEPRWLGLMSIAMKDPLTGELTPYPPSVIWFGKCTMPGTILGGIIDITQAFPLTPDQKLAEHRDDLAAQARLLQPAQLRMALLMNPILAIFIQQQLDQPPVPVIRTQDSEVIPDFSQLIPTSH